jgi:hypothetical protein
MILKPLDIRSDVSIQHAYFEATLPSAPNVEVLVVSFWGKTGSGCANNVDATYMEAMIRAGLTSFACSGVMLDLREMAYEWGDLMQRPFDAHEYLPIVAVVSDLNREGLTSLMRDEAEIDPATVLFESMEDALARLDFLYHADHADR